MGASLMFGNKLYIATLFVTIYNTKLHHKFQFATQCHSFNSAPRMHAHISSCCSATPQQAVNKRSCRGWAKAFKQVHVQKLLVLFWSVSDALNSSDKTHCRQCVTWCCWGSSEFWRTMQLSQLFSLRCFDWFYRLYLRRMRNNTKSQPLV